MDTQDTMHFTNNYLFSAYVNILVENSKGYFFYIHILHIYKNTYFFFFI